MRTLRAATLLSAILVTGAAFGHPVHEIVQNAYLTLSPGSVRLELELTAGPQVAPRILRALDSNGDRRITPVEARAYAGRVLAQSQLTIDRRLLKIRILSVDVPSYSAVLGAHGTIRITAVAARPDQVGATKLAYRNGYSPAESRCDANIFIKAGAGLDYRINGQDRSLNGRALVVRYSTIIGHAF